MSTGLGDGVVNASLEPGQHGLASCSLAAEEQHQDEVVLGSPEASSEPVGPHACGMTAGSTCVYLSLVFGRVNGLNFHHLYPLDPAC